MLEKKEESRTKRGPVVGGVCARRWGVCIVVLRLLCGGQGGGSVLPFLATRFGDGDGHRDGSGDSTRLVTNAAGEHNTYLLITMYERCTVGALRRTLYNESKKVNREMVS